MQRCVHVAVVSLLVLLVLSSLVERPQGAPATGPSASDDFLFGVGYATRNLAAAFASLGTPQAKLNYKISPLVLKGDGS